MPLPAARRFFVDVTTEEVEVLADGYDIRDGALVFWAHDGVEVRGQSRLPRVCRGFAPGHWRRFREEV